MNEFPPIDVSTEARRFASHVREIYDALTNEGFSDGQAMDIILVMLEVGAPR